jgi:guanylate kinase
MTIVVITGPTCSGKSSVEKSMHALGYAKMISHTTRAPRVGEVHGVDYHFISEIEFSDMKETNRFVETVEFGGARYGKSVTALVDVICTAEHAATVLEPQGARALRARCKDMGIPFVNVWLDCSPVAQAERFLDRITGNPLAVAGRLASMLSIEQDWRDARHSGQYDLDLATHLHPVTTIAAKISEFVHSQ